MQGVEKLIKLNVMRIGIFDPYLDDLGGGEKYMMSIATCLAKQHDVSVFWDKQDDIARLVERFSFDFRGVKRTKNIFSPQVSSIDRIRETKKYDVVIVLSDGSIPFSLSKKLMLHIQQPLDPKSVSGLKTKLKLSRVDTIFYNSKFSASFNENIFSNVKNTIIYPPVPIHAKQGKKENIILHVGRFRVVNIKNSDYKKQQTMVNTFKEMVDTGLKDWKFVVATSVHDMQDELFKKMLDSAKGYPIEFLVNKQNTKLWDTYNKAKIYWHASGFGEDLERHPEYAEHFGISTVEAMGAGAVPVVINAGGQKEIITHGKNGMLWDTLEELKEMTKSLMNNSDQLQKLSKEAQHRAKDFSPEVFCKRVNALI